MSLLKRCRFPVATILLCMRWYCKYRIGYRDLAEMMSERGVAVDPSTIFRWVQRYAPEIELACCHKRAFISNGLTDACRASQVPRSPLLWQRAVARVIRSHT